MNKKSLSALALLLGLQLNPLGAWASDGPMDFLFTTSGQPPKAEGIWKFGELSAIRTSALPPGTDQNQHPATTGTDNLTSLLAGIQIESAKGKFVSLFSRAELENLAPALVNALSSAGPGNDLLVMATARREGGMLSLPQTVLATVFVRQNQLHVLVKEARADLLSRFRSTHIKPVVEFSSRSQASGVKLQSAAGVNERSDWLALPLNAQTAATTGNQLVPASRAVTAVKSENFYNEQAKRLQGLKMLREQNLISEDEYQAKRKAIIEGL